MRGQSFALVGLLLANDMRVLAADARQSTEPLRLPISIVRANPITTITVGNRVVQAGVDTGGGILALSREVIEAAGGVKLPEKQVSNDALGNEYVHERFSMPLIEIGGRAFRDTIVIDALNHDAGNGPPIPNSIGRHFLSQYFVVVDYAGGAITLWPPGSGNADRAGCGAIRIPLEPTNEAHLAVSVFDTPSGQLRLAWDTGATYSMLPESLVEKRQLQTINRGRTKFYQPPTLSAAGKKVLPVEFVVLPLKLPADFQGMLGANMFLPHVVCFDYQNREVRIR